MFEFKKVCRACLINIDNKTHQISLLSPSNINSLDYRCLLNKCVNIEISSRKELPTYLCKICASALVESYKFITKFLESDEILTNALDENVLHSNYANKEDDFENEIHHSKNESTDGFKNGILYSNKKPTDVFHMNEISIPEVQEHSVIDDFNGEFNEINTRKDKSNVLKCSLCEKQFKKPCYVIRHMRSHTKEKPFQCRNCDKRFTAKYSMLEHRQRRHSDVKECTCEVCGKQFYNKRALNQHSRSHSDQANFKCMQCPKVFKFSGTLSRHISSHAKQKDHCCNICGKMFAHKQYLHQHLKATHSESKNFTCTICGKKIKTLNGFKSHNKLHSNEKPFSCDQCGMQFAIKIGLLQHFHSHHQTEKSGRCEVCKKGFHNLEEHLRLHSREAIYQCDICEQKFMLKSHLQRHIVLKHQNASKFVCKVEVCGKTFPLRFMLDYHTTKNHTKEPSHLCAECNAGFYRSCDLAKHSKMHNVENCNIVKSVLPAC